MPAALRRGNRWFSRDTCLQLSAREPRALASYHSGREKARADLRPPLPAKIRSRSCLPIRGRCRGASHAGAVTEGVEKRGVGPVGCHSEKRSDEESRRIRPCAGGEILRFAQDDKRGVRDGQAGRPGDGPYGADGRIPVGAGLVPARLWPPCLKGAVARAERG